MLQKLNAIYLIIDFNSVFKNGICNVRSLTDYLKNLKTIQYINLHISNNSLQHSELNENQKSLALQLSQLAEKCTI